MRTMALTATFSASPFECAGCNNRNCKIPASKKYDNLYTMFQIGDLIE